MVTDYFSCFLISKPKRFVFSSLANIFKLALVEQIFLTNSKVKFDVVPKPTMSENEDLFQRHAEFYYYCSIKTRTMLYRLVICIHMQ